MIASRPVHAIAMAAVLSVFALTGSAAAQMPTPGAPLAGPGLHRPVREEQVPPPALPGAVGSGDISTGEVATSNEDPTKLLFSAINHGDYTQARAAVSRGANLDAHNALGETPIEMSVELNRNNITFMLLSVRQEEGQGSEAGNPAPAPVMPHPAVRTPVLQAARSRPIPRASPPTPPQPDADQPGVPNPAAGFLGFGGHS